MRAAAAAATAASAASAAEQGRSNGMAASAPGSQKQSSTLVNNVQPIAYSMPPPYDSVA